MEEKRRGGKEPTAADERNKVVKGRMKTTCVGGQLKVRIKG
jgi:hypothetical protein